MNVALLTGTLIAAAGFGPIKQIDAGVLNIGYVELGPAGGTPVVLLHGWPYDAYEQKLSARPPITVPAITIGSDFDGPFADGKAYASQFTGKHSHRVLKGIGHNLPQEAPAAFVQAIVDVDGSSR